MKEINKSLGVISVIVLFTGVIFKKFHLSGASVLLTLGAFAVIAFFIIFLIKGIKPLSSGLEKLYGIIGVIAMCIATAVIIVAFTVMYPLPVA